MADDKYYRRRRRGAVLYTPIAAILIIVIVIFGISVFFRISDIEVKGAGKYTVDQIISASGIKIGDNLVFIDPGAVAAAIKTNLPYLSDVQISKIVPDKIAINVTESQPLAAVSVDNTWYIIDQKARVLEKTDSATAQGKISVTGLIPTDAPVGRQLAVGDGEQTKLLYLANVLSAIQNAGISGDVQSVDVSNIGNIQFSYGRFTVIMGTGEDADYKMVKLHDVIATLEPDDTGKIDVSQDAPVTARFIPVTPN
ncbi:Cell division septal protein FtsQ [Sporobacter termitidis DSM 10068]|uniref:Cell division septal protein FtsQ n=1 Tax=Sporobacter termitidis DSM 10068 TaxID=1123282 RepID=A0A1M5WZJ9_9FIRM|nr:FtsQ-type POTRA domain-containing protein [Sporobacter termitidis]SHH92951.1 Cell division septal protein FtsQ [Sporobacter termitidis DSM 10068]